jgi:hypothetical protein
MKSRAGSTPIWIVVLLACLGWVAFSFHDQAESAWHKAAIAADPADKLGTSQDCPALLSSANPDDIQYCVKRSLASVHVHDWAALGYLAILVLSAPLIVLGFFAAVRWAMTIIKHIPPHDTAHDRHA